jgi:hypothetical protein
MNNLIVYNFNNKIRLGEISDGGYVLGELNETYDCYISAGVSNEESFSRDFINKYNTTNNYAFDGTIEGYPYHYTNQINFIKKNINNINDELNTNLDFLIEQYNNIFLKMDIEGGEYTWLLSLNENKLNKFRQIVIEFHGITDNGYECLNSDKFKCLEKLSNTHYLIHAHGNNNCPVKNRIPDVIELTYINKTCFKSPPNLNEIPLPIKNLDFRNIISKPEINMNCYPFVKYNSTIQNQHRQAIPNRRINKNIKLYYG